mmetsp:Transcript_18165/g.46115  ORF Transcript_18165/g.46115 Transcript_18165/m.46115 type:complete len:248 (+) Transcript_18165:202-945(+)
MFLLEFLENRRHHTPRFCELITSHEMMLLTTNHVQQEALIGIRHPNTTILVVVGQIQFTALYAKRKARSLETHFGIDGFTGLHTNHKFVSLQILAKDPARDLMVLNTNLCLSLVQGLATLDDERNTIPTFVIHMEDSHCEGGRDRVIWHLIVVTVTLRCFGIWRGLWISNVLTNDHIFKLHWFHASKNAHLLVTNISRAKRARLLHRNQSKELKEVILHDVTNDSTLVKVATTTKGTKRLLERDLDT